MWGAFLIFSAKNISTLDFRHTRRLNESLTNDFVKLTMLWTTGPLCLKVLWVNKDYYGKSISVSICRGVSSKSYLLPSFICFFWKVGKMQIQHFVLWPMKCYLLYIAVFQGPIVLFNAKNHWSAPRTVILNRAMDQGFGFSVRGDSPVKVADIEPGSVAEVRCCKTLKIQTLKEIDLITPKFEQSDFSVE